MSYASYKCRRLFGPVWTWKARLRGAGVAQGLALGRDAACAAARERLQSPTGGRAALRKGGVISAPARRIGKTPGAKRRRGLSLDL
jgi:hypothetical protein